MVWKCPKCGFKGGYRSVQKHYFSKHYKHKEGSISKSKSKKVYSFHPRVPRRR